MPAFDDIYFGNHVKNGCRLLDKRKRGWWRKIKLARFDAQNPKTCILAQLYGSFVLGARLLGLDGASVNIADYGFCSSNHNPYWRAEILKRRAKAKARELAKV